MGWILGYSVHVLLIADVLHGFMPCLRYKMKLLVKTQFLAQTEKIASFFFLLFIKKFHCLVHILPIPKGSCGTNAKQNCILTHFYLINTVGC